MHSDVMDCQGKILYFLVSYYSIVMFLRELQHWLIDITAQNWHYDVINNHKLNMYNLYKSTLEI